MATASFRDLRHRARTAALGLSRTPATLSQPRYLLARRELGHEDQGCIFVRLDADWGRQGVQPMAKLQVLVLDDEPIVGKLLRLALSKTGCEVEAYEDPAAAFRRIDEKEFDVVVSDIVMGEIDGLQVLERVRQRFPRAKVIMITGYAMMSMARSAMEKGAFDFIAKPFRPDELRAVVARAAAELGIPLEQGAGEAHAGVSHE